jgi:hypothetical protein
MALIKKVGVGVLDTSPFKNDFDIAVGGEFIRFDPLVFYYLKYVEVQKGSTGYVLRGFVYQKGCSVVFEYYDNEDESWHQEYILDLSVGEIDVTYSGKFIWVVNQEAQGATAWWDNETEDWITTPFGHNGCGEWDYNPGWIKQNASGTGLIYYVDPVYSIRYSIGIGYRFGDSRRNVWSPLRVLNHYFDTAGSDTNRTAYLGDVDAAGTGTKIQIPVSSEDTANYDTIEVYRTIVNGSTFFREIYYHLPTEEFVGATLADFRGNGGTRPTSILGSSGGEINIRLGSSDLTLLGDTDVYVLQGGVTDDDLVGLKDYNSSSDDGGPEPRGTRMIYTDGMNMIAVHPTQEGAEIADIRWSRLDEDQRETFPSLNIFRPRRLSDQIETWATAGDFVFGLASNRLYRIQRVGTAIARERILHGHGILNRNAVADLGVFLAFMGQSDLVFVNPATGAPTLVGAVTRILNDVREWGGWQEPAGETAGDKSDIFLVYDSRLNCLFCVNPYAKEAICIWSTSNTPTMLEDMVFAFGTSGPDPVDGGIDRGYFMTSSGVIVSPDGDRTTLKRDMMGVGNDGVPARTLNGTVTTANTGSVRDSAAVFKQPIPAGTAVHFLSGTLQGQRAYVASNTQTLLTLTDGTLYVPLGTRYTLAPIPFEIPGWPVGRHSDPRIPMDLFTRRKVISIGYDLEILEGESSPIPWPSTAETVRLGVYNDFYSDPVVSKWVVPNENTDNSHGAVPSAGAVLWPSFRWVLSGMDFALRGLTVRGEMTTTEDL